MKKLLILILALVMCLSVLTGCDQIKGIIDGIIGGGDEEIEYKVENARNFLNNMYKNENSVTAADYEVVGQVRVAGVPYAVTWTVDTDKVTIEGPVTKEDGSVVYTVNVDEKSTEEVAYVLTATITAGNGDTATVTFNRSVPKYNVLSWSEYMAAEKGANVTVEGIVVAMNAKSLGNSRNHLFLADASGKGGYYVYQMDVDPVEAGVKVGMTVSVNGPVEPYSGMQEIKGGTFTIVDETIKTVAPIDITELVAAGTINYADYVALPVVIKGVTLGAQDMEKASSQYLYFTMPDAKGTQGYVRTYVTDFPTTLDIIVNEDSTTSSNAKTAIDKLHAEHFGYKADVSGILILYSGNPYLIPMSVDCFTNLKEVTYTAEEKVDAELGSLTLEGTVTSDTVVDLLAVGQYYNDVTITWTSDNAELAAIADGKLTLTVPTTSTTVKVTATVTCGDVTKTKEFSIKLSMEATPIADIIALAKTLEDKGATTTDKYVVAGVVVEVKNTQYGNLYIQDAAGNKLYIYGLYDQAGTRYDKMENAPQVGDYITVLSVVGHYNEPQLKNAVVLSKVSPTTITEANTIAGTLEDKGPTTEDKYLITGKVVEVANAKYGNLYIEDEAGNKIYVYGLYDVAGNRYDAMVTNGNAPVVGDTITVLSVIGHYNNPQLKNAVVVGCTAAAAHECASVCPACEKCTNAECTEEVCAEKCEGHVVTTAEAVALPDGTAVTVTGSVVRVDTAWSDDYGNITVTIGDAAGTLYVYRLATKVEVGQVITVKGTVGSYKGAKQIAAGATATIDETHTHTFTSTTVDSTCVVAGTTTYTCECGTTIVETLALAAHSTNENSVWTTVTAAGCTTLGEEKTTCAVCNEAEITRDVAVLGHTIVDGVCSVCNTKVDVTSVNVSDLTITTTTDVELVEGTGITASAGLAVDDNEKSIDGYSFTRRLKLGGTMKFEDDVVKAGVKIVVDGPATIVVYGMSSSGSATRTLRLCTLANGKFTSLYEHTNVVGSAIGKYVFAVEEAGTYYLGSKSSGINIYYIEVATTVKEETPASTTVTYNFATTSTQKGEKLANDTALTLFTASGSADVLASVTVENVYDGNGDGGAYPQASGFVKFGKSKTDGTLTLDFGDKKVVKIEIKCHDWYTKSDSYPTNSNKVSVNGSAEVLAPYNEAGTPEVLTFTVDNASTVTIVANDRVFVFEIVVTFAE